jgi:tRNA U34 5-carboxymethylaminomethyl modifying enzyme MnmG/GidA
LRLTEQGYEIGCVDEYRYEKFKNFKKKYLDGIEYLDSESYLVSIWKSKIPNLPIKSNTKAKLISFL